MIMKNWKRICFVCVAAATLAIGCHSMAFAAGEISVTGSGVVLAKPDTATISLSVETNGKTSESAQKETSKTMQKVTDTLLEMGIQKDKIVTTGTFVYPSYQYDDATGKRTITGYRSTANIQAVTKDIDNAGKYIDAALKAGATGTDGVSFSVENESAYYAQALETAVKNAADSAAAIAGAYGKPLGEVKSVTENSRSAYYVENSKRPAMPTAEGAAADTGAGGTTIQYGDIHVTANISVVYVF